MIQVVVCDENIPWELVVSWKCKIRLSREKISVGQHSTDKGRL